MCIQAKEIKLYRNVILPELETGVSGLGHGGEEDGRRQVEEEEDDGCCVCGLGYGGEDDGHWRVEVEDDDDCCIGRLGHGERTLCRQVRARGKGHCVGGLRRRTTKSWQ